MDHNNHSQRERAEIILVQNTKKENKVMVKYRNGVLYFVWAQMIRD